MKGLICAVVSWLFVGPALLVGAAFQNHWDDRFFISGVNGFARAAVSYNGKLIVGGQFNWAGLVPATNVASWDGTSWLAVNLASSGWQVNGLTVLNGSLFAAGSFVDGPITNIAHWDGTRWQPVGWSSLGYFNDLHGANGQLFGHGQRWVGNVSYYFFGRWDGSEWRIDETTNGPFVTAFASDGSNTYVGGSFRSLAGIAATNLARFDGQNWFAVSANTPPGVSRRCGRRCPVDCGEPGHL